MERYSIRQAAEQLGVSTDTLRYYDRMQLVCPRRGENRYRYYTKQDINDLLYVRVMKHGGFSLEAIRQVLYNKSNVQAEEASIQSSLAVIAQKQQEMAKTIAILQGNMQILGLFADTLRGKQCSEEMDELVLQTYRNIVCAE